MSDLQDALDGIRELHENDYDEGRWSWGGDPYDNAQQTAGRLLAAVEAVLDTVERHPVLSKRDDPTGEIATAVERFGDAIEDTIREYLEAP